MNYFMELSVMFLLLKVGIWIYRSAAWGPLSRRDQDCGLSPLRQMDSICRFCNDYVLSSVNESSNFHVWGSELGDYDISSMNTSPKL